MKTRWFFMLFAIRCSISKVSVKNGMCMLVVAIQENLQY